MSLDECALADANFHRIAYGALRIPVHEADGMWWVEEAASPVFPTAGTMQPYPDKRTAMWAIDRCKGRCHVRDHWAVLDLTEIGLRPTPDVPWMVREPMPIPTVVVPGLEIVHATTPEQVLLFERTTIAATGTAPRGHRAGAIHPAQETAALQDLHLFVGLIDDQPVATSLAAVHPEMVLISAVTTAVRQRGRGIGTALTRAALSVAPDLPAALGASDMGRHVYERLGFIEVGAGLMWQ